MEKQTSILLVNPKCQDQRISEEDALVVPIGLYYIGAMLLENEFKTQILNLAEVQKNTETVFMDTVKRLQPDVIGFSVTNPSRWNAIECAKTAKKLNPQVKIVFGGPAATFMANILFELCPQIDLIVSGEGETTFLDLVQAVEDDESSFNHIQGLCLLKDGRLISTPARPPLETLDSLVHPSKYFKFQHLAMSRGCPGNCTFCGSPRFWGSRSVRFHSAHWFAAEIEMLAQKGIGHFYVSDDTFTMDKPRVLEFCQLIEKKQLGVTWNAISRVDHIDEDLLYAMRKAGCIQISYGIESGSEPVRKILGKPLLESDIIHTFSLTRSYGILPRAYFIYGSPGETDETIQDSIDLMEKIKPLSTIFYMLVIFPGTYLYQWATDKNLVNQEIWSQKVEDLAWFEIDPDLDFSRVKKYGQQLRDAFFKGIENFALDLDLVDKKDLYPFHADFLSRLAMTFSHGEYSRDPRLKNAEKTAILLFEKALTYAPNPRASMGLSMIRQKNRQFDLAVNLLEDGLKHAPSHPDLNVCLGLCMMNMGQFERALDYFTPFRHLEQTHHYIDICQNKISG